MDYAVPFFLILCMAGINAYKTGHHSLCGRNERRALSRSERDVFCKPQITPGFQLTLPRRCVCKSGYVRNCWGECITLQECRSCARRSNMDYNLCKAACPVVCGEKFSVFCKPGCHPGCVCAPDYALDRTTGRCVSASRCRPKCPNNSHFTSCVNTCEPSCDGKRPPVCVTTCDKGGCTCNHGYSKKWTGGTKRCILTSRCAYVK